jgi:hypothetical protein
VELVATLDFAQLTPGDGVLIVHPEVELEYEGISGFLRAGGRVAVLDDYGSAARLLSRFQIHRIRAPLKPLETLRDNPNFAVAVPFVQRVAGHEQGRHPIVNEVDKLVTNHPTGFTHPNLTPVLTIAASDEPDATLAVTGVVAQGRLFAMGDPSAVINLMLRYRGNRAFAKGLCEYLVEDDTWGSRNGKLYLVANDFRQQGRYGKEAGLLSDAMDNLRSVLDALGSAHDEGLPDRLAVVLALLAAAGAAVWAALAAARTYRRLTPRYAAPTPLVAQGGAPGRAAVLASPTTPRALVLLELKSALEERLRARLELTAGVGIARILAEIDRQGALSRRSFQQLRDMFEELGKLEAKIASAQQVRIAEATVERVRRLVTDVLAELDERMGSPK